MSSMTPDEVRAEAIKRVKAKQNFARMAGGFVILWLLMIAIWAFSGRGYFWPMWVIIGTGIALLFSGWNVYGPKQDVTEGQIDAEVRKIQGGN